MLGDSVRRRQGKRASKPRGGGKRNWKAWLIGVPIALVLPFIIGYFIAVRVIFPPPPMVNPGIVVPDLRGRTAAGAARMLDSLGVGALEQSELPHPTAPAGEIIAQSPLPGQQLRDGGVVEVALSAGRPRVLVPDVLGFSADRATAMLQRSGFTVAQTTRESEIAAGRVIAIEPEPGQVLELPANITLVVSVPLPADSIVRDTMGVPARRDTAVTAHVSPPQRRAAGAVRR
jgi:serine/threonine-protein kinase